MAFQMAQTARAGGTGSPAPILTRRVSFPLSRARNRPPSVRGIEAAEEV